MKWDKALPVSTSKSVVITTMCECKARFTWCCEMGESTDYQEVISDHHHEWTNCSGSGGSAHPSRVGSWYLHLDGVTTATSVVFLLQEPSCKCNSIVLQARSTKALSLCELETVVISCWQKQATWPTYYWSYSCPVYYPVWTWFKSIVSEAQPTKILSQCELEKVVNS